jgi:hypothetical protein
VSLQCQKGIRREVRNPNLVLKLAGFGLALLAKCQKASKWLSSGLDLGEIDFGDFPFRHGKAANDKMVPDRVGSEVFVLQKLPQLWLGAICQTSGLKRLHGSRKP